MGLTLMDDVPGPHFTFVDPLLAINAGGMVRQAMKLVRLFEAAANGERAKVEDQVISNEDVEDQEQEINCGDADSQGAGRQRLKRKDIIVCVCRPVYVGKLPLIMSGRSRPTLKASRRLGG